MKTIGLERYGNRPSPGKLVSVTASAVAAPKEHESPDNKNNQQKQPKTCTQTHHLPPFQALY